jgi:hypothetical protein
MRDYHMDLINHDVAAAAFWDLGGNVNIVERVQNIFTTPWRLPAKCTTNMSHLSSTTHR